MDEFQDETEFKKLNEREVTAWLEVGIPYFVSASCTHMSLIVRIY